MIGSDIVLEVGLMPNSTQKLAQEVRNVEVGLMPNSTPKPSSRGEEWGFPQSYKDYFNYVSN